jgi:hypothetical protein
MTPERDTVNAVRRTLRPRGRTSPADRAARRDVALVNGWLRSLTLAYERDRLAEAHVSAEDPRFDASVGE